MTAAGKRPELAKIDLDPTKRPTLSVDEFAVVVGISRSTAFIAVHDGTVPSLRFGGRIRIPTSAVRRMLQLEDIEQLAEFAHIDDLVDQCNTGDVGQHAIRARGSAKPSDRQHRLAFELCDCPLCGAPAGSWCRTSGGHQYTNGHEVHEPRRSALAGLRSVAWALR